MRDKDDIPYAKTVLNSYDVTAAIPLQHTVTNEDGSETTCSIAETTEFEDLIHKVYPDLLEANHNIFNDRGILAPTNDIIDQIKTPSFIKCLDVVTNNIIRTRSSKMTKTCQMLFPANTSIASTSPARHRTNSTSKLAH
ncbi:unnamed protein product [Ectocarpus sp. 4 AP-2014]